MSKIFFTIIFLIISQSLLSCKNPAALRGSIQSATIVMRSISISRSIAKLNNNEKAIVDFDRAIEIDPKYANAYNSRGAEKFDLENYRGAISDYDRAISIEPTGGSYYFNRGNAKSKLDDKNGAIADWKKAAALYQDQKQTDRYQDAMQSIENLK